jgi:branched-chain amino acid transport system substrate-binding protein
MKKTTGRRFGAILAGLALVGAAACGGDDEGAESTEAPAASEAPAETEAPAATEAPVETEAPAAEGVCQGESDGVLTIGSVLPETGNLAFLGPPEFAAVELAVADINAAGGVLGADVEYVPGDSGDTSTDIANQTVDAGIAAGVDAFIGAASSGVSFTFIDKLVENCKIHFSPANTSPDFTDYEDGGLYFRTAPSDVLQGRVLADLMIEEGVTNAVFMALQDPYGEGLLKYSSEPYAEQGGEVIDAFTYDPNQATFDAEVDRVISADPEALVIIGFAETQQILTGLFENGFTPDVKKIYFVDGNIGNATAEGFEPGSFLGIKGTLPAAEAQADFQARLLEIDPELTDYSYAPEAYDAVIITALAAAVAGSDDPGIIATQISGVTKDGEVCTTFADCMALIEAGTDIDYDGPSGPQNFSDAGEPTEASFQILSYDANNDIYGEIPIEYRFAKI